MKPKSLILKEYFRNKNIQLENLSENFELVVDATSISKMNISKRGYKEEIKKVKEDLKSILEKKIFSITFQNINIEECNELGYIMQKIAENTKKITIKNSNIGNLDLYMSTISGRIGKNYSLSENQYIKEFEYNKENEMLVMAAENLDILSEINRYKKPKLLKIKIYSKNDLQILVKYIDVIREMKLSKNILFDKSKEKISDIYKYENYINEKVIILQSDLLKESLGLDRLPTKKVNQTVYNLKIDGSKVNNKCIYILEGKQEELFIKDMQDISKYINLAKIDYKNVIFSDNYDIKQVINKVENSIISKELVDENFVLTKRSLLDVIIEKISKVFNINLGVKRKQKAFPVD